MGYAEQWERDRGRFQARRTKAGRETPIRDDGSVSEIPLEGHEFVGRIRWIGGRENRPLSSTDIIKVRVIAGSLALTAVAIPVGIGFLSTFLEQPAGFLIQSTLPLGAVAEGIFLMKYTPQVIARFIEPSLVD